MCRMALSKINISKMEKDKDNEVYKDKDGFEQA